MPRKNIREGLAPALGMRSSENCPSLSIAAAKLPGGMGSFHAVVNAGQEIVTVPAAPRPSGP